MTAQALNPEGLVIGVKMTIDGVTYVVTKDGIERFAGSRKERRAAVAGLRTKGSA